jgi:hypothetical protein
VTILCAITDGSQTVIGSDSAMFNGNTVRDFGRSKFFHWPASGWHVGISASLRMWAHAKNHMSQVASWDAYGLAEAFRKFVGDDEWKKREDAGDPWRTDSGIILARPGEVWEIASDFSACRIPSGEVATTGAGWQLATGAGYALAQAGGGRYSQSYVVRGAVEAAIARSVWCGGRAFVEVLKPQTGAS